MNRLKWMISSSNNLFSSNDSILYSFLSGSHPENRNEHEIKPQPINKIITTTTKYSHMREKMACTQKQNKKIKKTTKNKFDDFIVFFLLVSAQSRHILFYAHTI